MKPLTAFSSHPFFELMFRSSFILTSIAGIAALLTWVMMLLGVFTPSSGGLSPVVWHIHEMLFGFGATVAVGFVLTAVQTWTGKRSLNGGPLICLTVLWLVTRILFYSDSIVFNYLAIIGQMLWWLCVIFVYARIVITTKNKRNYVFIGVFSVMAGINLAIILSDLFGHTALALHFGRTTVLLFGVLMTLIGGRVIPMFTANRLQLERQPNKPFIEHTLPWVMLVSVICFALQWVFTLAVFDYMVAAIFVLLGTLHTLRLVSWHGLKTRCHPLLWSLHIAYLFMAVGFFAVAASLISTFISLSAALHIITIGAMSLMILSMMSRVSLGHTGRKIEAPRGITTALLLMVLAVIARVCLPVLIPLPLAWVISAACWSLSLLIFVVIYLPVLASPRKTG